MIASGPDTAVALPPPLALVLAAAGVMAASGFVAALVGRRPRAADRVALGLLLLGGALGLCAVWTWFGARDDAAFAIDWALPWGRFSIAIDGLSAGFLLPILVVCATAAIYGSGYWPQSQRGESARKLRIFFGLLAASLTMLVVARDGLLFVLAFEVMALSAFFLITTEDEREDVRQAGWLYFVASHVSLMFLLAAFALLRSATGSLEMVPAVARTLDAGTRTSIFVLVLVGFGIKAGIMPLHVWLPSAHATAPSHVSAVLSGVVIKTGIYGLARFTAILPEPPMIWGASLLVLGAVSGVVGVAYAIGQHDLKRLLAYHSIENIGIIVMGLGLALLGKWGHSPVLVVLGLASAVMHVWNHGLFKSLLFLSAGAVIHASGTRDIERMGALSRSMPWSAALFTVGAIAICGLPPFNGFISEFLLYSGALRGWTSGEMGLAVIAAPVLASIGALACACFIKVIGCVFLGHPRSDAATRAHECNGSMRWPMLFLALLCAALGLAPILAAPLLDAAVGAWTAGSGLVPPTLSSLIPFGVLATCLVALLAVTAAAVVWLRATAPSATSVPTWDCGYLSPTARMQYSASSVARGLVQLFRPVLSVEEHAPRVVGPFPPPATYRVHVEDRALQRVLLPFCTWVAERCASTRRWQTGRIQTYVLYVILTTIALMLFVIPIRSLLDELISR
jgi:hydrogenase-4 component B